MSNQSPRLDARTKKDSNAFILAGGCFTAAASFICVIAALVFLNVGNANIPTAFILGAVGSLIAGYVFFGTLFHSARTGQDDLPNYREQYAAQMAAREKAAEEKTPDSADDGKTAARS